MATHSTSGKPLPRPSTPLSLPHLIQPASSEPAEESPEDIVASSLSLLDPFAATNQHGDPGAFILYNVRDKPPLILKLSDPGFAPERWLFAHYVWNAGVLLAECIASGWWWERLPEDDSAFGMTPVASQTRSADWSVKSETLLELGAGTGLVGLCAARAGAHRVVITDYPAQSILATLQANLEANGLSSKADLSEHLKCDGRSRAKTANNPSATTTASKEASTRDLDAVVVRGHEWGSFNSEWAASNQSSFTRILAADTLWLEGAHAAQAASMAWFLERSLTARVWVIAGFHTGRAKVRSFLEEAIPQVDLTVLKAWEVDVTGKERHWEGHRQEVPGEAARWSVVAIIGWEDSILRDPEGHAN
jgi:EEF1A N-terminal glycine/lysine methyltransferase